jgi:hypothetical protein
MIVGLGFFFESRNKSLEGCCSIPELRGQLPVGLCRPAYIESCIKMPGKSGGAGRSAPADDCQESLILSRWVGHDLDTIHASNLRPSGAKLRAPREEFFR